MEFSSRAERKLAPQNKALRDHGEKKKNHSVSNSCAYLCTRYLHNGIQMVDQ